MPSSRFVAGCQSVEVRWDGDVKEGRNLFSDRLEFVEHCRLSQRGVTQTLNLV